MTARKLKTERKDIVVENHPYDKGYWARYDGRPKPKIKGAAEGWNACDSELREESHPGNRS